MAEIGLAVAQTLFAALNCSELKQICAVWGYKSQLEDLRKTVNTIKNVLKDAENKVLTHEAQGYVDELKDALYEADDLFDEFVTLLELNQLQKSPIFSKSKLLPETVKAMDKSSLEYTMMLAELTAGEMNIPPPPPNPRQAPVAMNAPVHDQGEQANADANAGDDPFGDNEPIEPSMFDETQGEEAPQADEQALDYADSDDANDEDDDDDDDDDEDDQLPRDDALVGDHESHSPEGAQPQLENSPASPDPDVTLYPKLSMRQKEKRVSRAMKNVLTPYEEKTYRSEGSPMIDAARDLWIEFSGRFEAINRELDETMKQYNDMLVDLKKVEKLLEDEKAAHGVLKNSVETLKKGHKDEVDVLNQKLKDSATKVEDLERDLKAAKDSVEASNQAAESSKRKLSDALHEKERLENQLKEGAANWFEQWKQSQAGQVYTGNIANQAKAKSVAALHEKYKTALGALIPEKAEEIMAAVQQEIDRERKAMMEAVRKQLQADQEAAAAAALKKQQDALVEAAEMKKAEAEKKGEAVYEKRSKKRNDKGQAKTPEGVADPGNPESVHHQSAPEGESKRQKTSHSSKSKQSSHASGVSQARQK